MITEYYPENAGEYLRKKKRLLEQAKQGLKGIRKQISKEDLKLIKQLLDEEIKKAFSSDLPLEEQFDVSKSYINQNSELNDGMKHLSHSRQRSKKDEEFE